VHLAFADGVDEMRVMFVCADAGKRSVRYGLGKEEEKGWTEVGTEVRTYEQKQMCDTPANGSVGWRDPGFVFDGLMKGLEPGRRYFYKVNCGLNLHNRVVLFPIHRSSNLGAQMRRAI
jgi:hypothetical protein